MVLLDLEHLVLRNVLGYLPLLLDQLLLVVLINLEHLEDLVVLLDLEHLVLRNVLYFLEHLLDLQLPSDLINLEHQLVLLVLLDLSHPLVPEVHRHLGIQGLL